MSEGESVGDGVQIPLGSVLLIVAKCERALTAWVFF